MKRSFSSRNTTLPVILLALSLGMAALTAQAQVIMLMDNNATATVDIDHQAGWNSWTVDGAPNTVNQQWFWYRVGNGTTYSLDKIGPTSFGFTPNSLTATYVDPQFSVGLVYTLIGGDDGSRYSQMQQSITIHNTSGAPLDLHFFQYADFDLAAAGAGDSVVIGAGRGGYVSAYQYNPNGNFVIEEITGPAANLAEAAIYPATRTLLNTCDPVDLNGITTALNNDVTYAFEWNLAIPTDGTATLLKQITVPEPSAFALLTLGLTAFGLRRNRRTAA